MTKLDAKYQKAVATLHRKERRMRRSFHDYEKARAVVARLEKKLDQNDPHVAVALDFNDRLEDV